MKSHSALDRTQRFLRVGGLHLALLGSAVALVSGGVSARAQQTGAAAAEQASRQAEAVKSQQQLQKQAQDEREKKAPSEDEPPETYPGENDDLGPQKLLKKKKRKPLFDFSSDTMLTWTNNALSVGERKTLASGAKTDPARDSGVLAETLSLAFAPQPLDIGIGKLGIRAGYRQLFYVYNALQSSKLNKNSFEMGTASIGSNLSFMEKWNASLGLDYSRILKLSSPSRSPYKHTLDGGDLQESFVDWSPNWSLMRSISFTEKLSMLAMYSGAYHFTGMDPVDGTRDGGNRNDKLDSTLMTSLMYSINSKWMLQPSFRFTHALYTQPNEFGVHRRDMTTSPGFSVIWTPTPQLSFRASVGGEFRKSNLNDGSAPDYKKFEAAVGISAMVKF
jgi:hypothetical protein